jgi:glycosyltransferase involved in cell wall biosynthesis
MQAALITAGAGGLYCGACGRDVTLARGLAELGCEAPLVPLYTPLTVDADLPPDTTCPFFGGINVYLQQHVPWFAGAPRLLTRCLDHPRLLAWAARVGVQTEPAKLGPMTVSVLQGERGRQRTELDRLLAFLEDELRPDIVGLTNSLLSAIAPVVKRRLGVPVTCSLQGEDAFVADLGEPYRTQAVDAIRRNVRDVDAFIAPYEGYADEMAGFLDVPRDRIRVIHAGIDPAAFAPALARPRRPFVLGYLSRITPSKGLDLLVEAVDRLVSGRNRDITVRVAGQRPDRRYFRRVQRMLRRRRLEGQFQFCDAPDRDAKAAFLQGCSAFCVPSRYRQVLGTAAMEAMAAGLPAVLPHIGVFPDLAAWTQGALLFPPEDAAALAERLAELMDDPDRADVLGLAARKGIRLHYAAARMAESTLQLYLNLVEERT